MVSDSSSSRPSLSAPIDSRRVRTLFSDPSRIADSDFLRREIARRMHERLALVKIQPRRILDAGCGEGADLLALQQQYPDAQVLGVDASVSMLQQVRTRQAAAQSSMNRLLSRFLPGRAGVPAGGNALLCADFSHLPVKPNSIDMLWSNLALHWHPQPDRVFAEWRRVLTIDGLLMFSCFGPDTFKEVRSAFAAIDQMPHVLPFVDMHDFGDMLIDTGFSTPVMDMETVTVTYASADKLIADVRAWGGNPLGNRCRGLLGRRARESVFEALAQNRDADGKIPLTFEIIYGHAFRPTPTKTSSGEAIIRFNPQKR
ncbi:methyltransferase domain-containing protein [Noviherbaspirillum autotrophicum]|uniref:methyltransferase domain-containing protein n=1 Tax=Noviherbaspirillum autotrophicum TaxID=709839 RepID=UPI0038CD1881